MSWQRQVDDINQKRALAMKQGGDEAVARKHARGELTIRERIGALVDKGSFAEHGIGAGGAERDEQGNLVDFTPGNYIAGLAKIRRALCGGRRRGFHRAGRLPQRGRAAQERLYRRIGPAIQSTCGPHSPGRRRLGNGLDGQRAGRLAGL